MIFSPKIYLLGPAREFVHKIISNIWTEIMTNAVTTKYENVQVLGISSSEMSAKPKRRVTKEI